MRNLKPFIIGISGGTCSGKSTIADRIQARMSDKKVRVFHMDTYFLKPGPTVIAPITGIEYPERNHPDALDQQALFQDFYAAADARDEAADDVIIIEGLFALYFADIRGRLDLKVFVDLKSDERIVRRIKRFTAFGQTLKQVTDRYLDTVRFRHDELIEPTRWHADIVINGVLDANKGTDVLLSYIYAQID